MTSRCVTCNCQLRGRKHGYGWRRCTWCKELQRNARYRWSVRVERWAIGALAWYAVGDLFWRLFDGHGMLG